ncbi:MULTISPECIES: T9SS type A sorting domain-containing protein [Winogradskyella]|uniref:T9SS type A sorting domain-containing protein n=1 Tax=Winogradskyella TaxID=286104 RepID=UPI0015CA9AAA|nr:MULTISPECIES: T9SS type A sorting domain-containing protein [Winogradskyella]QXP78091.1 T9SS type A sorting domain-containing protein [Winogradskyella sp. HaHa_3_26]
MKQKLLNLFLFLIISITSFAQVANQPNDYVVCDDDNDGFALFDLTYVDVQVLGSQSAEDYTITYHETQSDAINGINALYYLYVNNTDWLQIIYVRLEDNNTGSYDTTELSLVVNPTPIVTASTSLELCDDDADEIAVFDLTIKDAEITNGNTDWSVTYYETNADAQAQTNVITNPTAYTNNSVNGYGANPQTLFVVVTDINAGCLGFTTLTIRVLPNPTPSNTIPDLVLCDEINTGDEVEVFDLTVNELLIFNGEPGTSITYHVSESDAFSGSNSISDPTQFSNTVSPQTIYARVTNNTTGCFAVVDFDIYVDSLPDLNFESSYSFCVGDTLVIDSELSTLDYSFQWALNGNPIPDETQASLTVTQSGFYEVSVISLLGCGTTIILINVEEIVCTDSDDDGVIDSDEDINGNGDLEDDDTDGDNIPNYLDSDDDGDNVATIDEINIVLGRSNNTIHQFVDTDEDEIENYLDDDDDGDGILTIDEDYNDNGDPTDDDTNSNTIPDYLESSVALSLNEFNVTRFNMFPNPAKENVTIQLASSYFETGSVNIYNIQGKIILNDIKLETNASTIDISSLESGLYFVELTVGNTSTIQKLIVS